MKITPEEFEASLPSLCDQETSSEPNLWSKDNPLVGHSDIVAVAVKKLFGGNIRYAPILLPLENLELKNTRAHFWNEIPSENSEDLREMDLTSAQYLGAHFRSINSATCRTKSILSNGDTKRRYKKFALRLAKKFSPNQVIADKYYEACFEVALDSPCRNTNSGGIIVFRDVSSEQIVIRDCNHSLESHLDLCEKNCRSGSLLTSAQMDSHCPHTEIRLIMELGKAQIRPDHCELYIIYLDHAGLPVELESPEFSCEICAMIASLSGIKSFRIPFKGRWVEITPRTALSTASKRAHLLPRL